MTKSRKKKATDKDAMPSHLPTPKPAPVPPSGGPIFVASFDDSVTTRMSIYSSIKTLDLKRAVAVSKAAHSSRVKKPMLHDTAEILTARYETTAGELLAAYQLDDSGELVPVVAAEASS